MRNLNIKKQSRLDIPLATTPEPIITRSESTDAKTGITTYKKSWNEESPKRKGDSKDRVYMGAKKVITLQSLPKLTPAGRTDKKK
jgi:hypothetical protein